MKLKDDDWKKARKRDWGQGACWIAFIILIIAALIQFFSIFWA